MSVTFPRLLGALAALWASRGVLWGPVAWATTESWLAATGLCGIAAAWLLVGRQVRMGAALLTAACVLEMFARPIVDNEPAILLAWIGTIVLLTEGEVRERAFLLRVCTTTVYAFAAASKVNPSWLAGEGVLGMATIRNGVGDPLALGYPLAVIAIEAWMAVGLWFGRTRWATATMGLCLHISILMLVSRSVADVLYLGVLNFGLVAMYVAYWFPLQMSDVFRRLNSRQQAEHVDSQGHPGGPAGRTAADTASSAAVLRGE